MMTTQNDPALIDALQQAAQRGNNFAQSLLDWHHQGRALTARQVEAAQRFVVNRPERAALPVSAPVNGSALSALFERAASRLKFPKVRFSLPEGTLVLKRAGAASRYHGSILITDEASYPNNRFYGRVEGNAFTPGRDCQSWILEALRAFGDNPAEYASAYGRKTGSCCFCHKALTDPASLAVGYGPVCADHYGIPHGPVAKVQVVPAAPAHRVTSESLNSLLDHFDNQVVDESGESTDGEPAPF